MRKNSIFKNIREYENLHIVFWLIKDTCWVMTWRLAGMSMIFPTLFVAVHLAWKSRKNTNELFHNVAVCLWICANATWMTGEFFYKDSFRPFASIFFAAGLLVVAVYYIFYFPNRNSNEIAETNNLIDSPLNHRINGNLEQAA